MTEAEFHRWVFSDEDIRAEWEDGEVIVLSPENIEHTDLLLFLFNLLRPYAEHRDAGTVLGPNTMVRFARQRRRRVPDLLFVAKDRTHILRPTIIDGAPDLIIEVVSPDSQSRDRRKKYADYQRARVREYWILDPLSRQMEAYALKRGKYAEMHEVDGIIRSVLLPGFYLKSAWLFRRPLPKVLSIQKELGLI
jgi:Uma2 family endonuclease